MANEIIAVNGSDREWTQNRYVFWFGAYGWTRLMAWGNSMEDALEACVDWLVDKAPGILCDDAMREEYEAALAEGCSEDEAIERSEMDVTVFGHSGYHGINSWEWGICAENPTRAEILEMMGRATPKPKRG